MQTTTATDRLIDTREACTILNIGPTSLYELISAGVIRPTKMGRKNGFSANETHRLVQDLLDNRGTPFKLRAKPPTPGKNRTKATKPTTTTTAKPRTSAKNQLEAAK